MDTGWNIESSDTPYHVVRGGGWSSSSDNCRISVRNDANAGWVNFAGFRLVKELNNLLEPSRLYFLTKLPQ